MPGCLTPTEVLTAVFDAPGGYGRIVRDGELEATTYGFRSRLGVRRATLDRADTTEFAVEGGFGRVQFGRDAGQLAFQPLLSSQEMGLGGRRFLRAFDYGADDYLTKPFGVGELLGHLRVLPLARPRLQRLGLLHPADPAAVTR